MAGDSDSRTVSEEGCGSHAIVVDWSWEEVSNGFSLGLCGILSHRSTQSCHEGRCH